MTRRPFARLGCTALAVAVLGVTMAPSALAAAPPAPESASAEVRPSGARVTWAPVFSEDLWAYFVKAEAGYTPPSDPSGGTPVDGFSTEVDLFLDADTTYAISVFACDGEMSCSSPATTSVTTPPLDSPFTTSVSATDTTAVIDYSYAAPGTVSGYRIAAAPDTATAPTDPFDPAHTWVDDAASPVTLTGLNPSTNYYLYLYPMFGPGWGAQGFGFLSTTAPAPAPVTALTAQSRPSGGVHLSWTPGAAANLTNYAMRYRVGVPPVTLDEGSGGPSAAAEATSLTFEGLVAGTNYGISIFACNSDMACSAPAGVSFTARSDQFPTVSVTSWTHNSAALSYSPVPGASSYKVGRGPDSADFPTGPTDPNFVWVTDAASPVGLSGLAANTGYAVHVIPVFSDGGWGQTGSDFFNTSAAPPPPATGLTATLSSAGTVKLTWTAASSPGGGWSVVGHNGPTDTITHPCPNSSSVCYNLGGAVGSARTYTITSAQIGNGQGSKWWFGVTPMSSEGVRGTTTKIATTPWSAAKLMPVYIGSTPSYSGGSYKMNLMWENPQQPNWNQIKVFFAAGATPPSDTGTPVFTCNRTSTPCAKTKLMSGLTNGARYSFSAYAYVNGTSPLQKAKTTGTDVARATGVVINGTWVTGSLPPHYYGEVELVFDSSGQQHLVYPREDGLYYARKSAGAAGTWTGSVKLPGSTAYDNYAELTILSNNTLVLAYNKLGDGPHFRTKTATGAWTAAARLGATAPPASGSPIFTFENIVRDSSNTLHALLWRRTYPLSATRTTDGLFYLKKTVTGAWTAPARVTGTTGFDSGMMTIDSSRTRIGILTMREGHPTTASNGMSAAVKGVASANFPTLTKLAGVQTLTDYPAAMTIHGTRVQVFLTRSSYPNKTTDGVFLRSGTMGGTATTPTMSWTTTALVKVGGTHYTDYVCGVAVNPANGETTLCLNRGPYGSTTAGLYLLKSSTTGAWGGFAAVRKTAAPYDYVTDVDYYANVAYLTWLRH